MTKKKSKKRYSNKDYVAKLKKAKVINDLTRGCTLEKAEANAGYKKGTYTPSSRTFQEVLQEILPDEFLVQKHKELMDDHRNIREIVISTTDDLAIKKAIKGLTNVSVVKNTERGYTTLIINEPDKQARRDALEMAYKIKGHYAPQQIEIKRDYQELSDEELTALVQDIHDDDANPLK